MTGAFPSELVPPGCTIETELGEGRWTMYARGRAGDTPVTIGVIPELPSAEAADDLAHRLRGLSGDETFPAPSDAGVIRGVGAVWYTYAIAAQPVAALRDRPPLASADVAAIGIAAANALAGRGAPHGGLHAATIHWDGSGIRIADAGVVPLLMAAGPPASGGAPGSLPPELAGGGPPSELADMYSLGAILYELLTGTPPFGGRTTSTVMASVLADEPRSAGASGARAPGYVVDAILRAIEKAPADRWPSLEAFASALGGGRPTTPPGAAEPVRRRRLGCLPALVAGAGTLAAALLDALRIR